MEKTTVACGFCHADEGHIPGCRYYKGNGESQVGSAFKPPLYCGACCTYGGGHTQNCTAYFGDKKPMSGTWDVTSPDAAPSRFDDPRHISICSQCKNPTNSLAHHDCLVVNRLDTREKYLNFFKSLTEKMFEITRKKNNDYGGATDPFKNFREFGAKGILVRMSDKAARLKTALWEEREFQVADESVEDTALDLAIYSLLLLCYIRSEGR